MTSTSQSARNPILIEFGSDETNRVRISSSTSHQNANARLHSRRKARHKIPHLQAATGVSGLPARHPTSASVVVAEGELPVAALPVAPTAVVDLTAGNNYN